MGAIESIEWHGEQLELFADRAVHWPAGKTLFIADPHFGKADTFRVIGIAVPGDGGAENCRRLSQLITATKCERLVILGDFLHSSWGRSDGLLSTLNQWRHEHEQLHVDLVRGNHDLSAGDPWPELRIECRTEPFLLQKWTCRHKPDHGAGGVVLAGHIHPAFRVADGRAPCFWLGETQMVLPAFGEFTGTHLIKPATSDRVFVTDGTEVIRIPLDLG
ncbi:MAG: ligase-associated DNA damage response endonuclease PdeM [Limisphaerales bacterium]